MVEINRIYHQLKDVSARYTLVWGGRRSGKSVAISQLLVMLACGSPRKILIVRKFGTSIRLSTWPRMLQAVDESVGLHKCQVRLVDKEIHLPNGSVFLFTGADDVEKMKSIEGLTDVWVEESTEIEENDLNVIDAGLSANVTPRPRIFFSFNPIPAIPGSPFWLQRRFLNRVPHELGKLVVKDDIAVLKTYYRHNAYCPPETVKLLTGYETDSPDLFEMWALGNWVILKGAILKDWDTEPFAPEGVPCSGFGLDYGFANDPAAVVKLWKRGRDIWIEEQLYATDLTNPDLSIGMQDAGMRPGVDVIKADSAEPKSIEEMRRMGWIISGAKKWPDYKREAALFLKGHHLHVVGASPNLKREIATWSWKQDPKDPEKVLPIVADGNDHTMDAMIYGAFTKPGALQADDISRARSKVTPYIRHSSIRTAVAAVAL